MYKTKITHDCCFGTIFHFAKKEYGIPWNDANRLFFKDSNTLRYKGMDKITRIDMYDGSEYMYNEGQRLYKELYPNKPMDEDKAWYLAQQIQIKDIKPIVQEMEPMGKKHK